MTFRGGEKASASTRGRFGFDRKFGWSSVRLEMIVVDGERERGGDVRQERRRRSEWKAPKNWNGTEKWLETATVAESRHCEQHTTATLRSAKSGPLMN